MHSLREVIDEARKQKRAVGHFNIADVVALRGIFRAARELHLPVLIGTSEGERAYLGPRQAAALVQSLREEFSYPIFLNADHTHSFEKIQEAVAAGYDAVLFDGSALSWEENIRETKRVVAYVKEKNPQILVEGEIGYIGSSSRVLDAPPKGAAIRAEDLTTPAQAEEFVRETGVDLLAPAVGNLHGMFRNAPNPRLDIARVRDIASAVSVPLVLHGGSGIADEDFVAAIEAGVAVVHINTELRLAWREGISRALQEKKDEIAPYKIYPAAEEGIYEVVKRRMALFSRLSSPAGGASGATA